MIYVKSIIISPENIIIKEGEWFDGVYAYVCPTNATNQSLSWYSSNSYIASVNSIGDICGVSEGTAVIYATATDGSGVVASCNVTVKKHIKSHAVAVHPSEKRVILGDRVALSAIAYPENADNKTVTWSSDDSNIASVEPQTGCVTGKAIGNTRIYATLAIDNSISGYCDVNVTAPIKVTSIVVTPDEKTVRVGDVFTLSAEAYPIDADNRIIRWESDDSNIASVEFYDGIVFAKAPGTTVIRAKSIDGSEKYATCIITVVSGESEGDDSTSVNDPRERVTIKKDSHSFYVEFADGKIWKNIGIDLSKRQENYNNMYPPNMFYENYDDLIEEEQRYFDNIYVQENGVMVNSTYSEMQIGFLYLLDPFGIEYYMRNHACQDMSLGTTLFFKDRVYKEIFGVWPRLIKVLPDKTIRYYVYSTSISAETRADYYTDAEILFGEHPIYDLLSLISFLLDVVPSVSLSLFSIFYPPAGVVLGSIDLVKFLFFSASASSVLSNGANSIMEEYTSNVYTLSGGESAGIKAGKAMGWVNFVLGTFSTILDAAEVFTPSFNDITIYNKINEGDYRVIYNVNGSELSMADIISRIS